MTQRIKVTDEMIDRAIKALYGSSSGTVSKALEAALGDLLERRKSERRGLQSGAYAPSVREAKGDATTEKAAVAAVECTHNWDIWWRYLTNPATKYWRCCLCNKRTNVAPTTGVTGGAPAQPKQASARLSASTTTPSQAPEVSEGMLEAGQKAWSDHPGMSVQKALPAIYRAMELKRRQELDEDQAYNG